MRRLLPVAVGAVGGWFAGRAISGLVLGANADSAELHPWLWLGAACAIDLAVGYGCYRLARAVL